MFACLLQLREMEQKAKTESSHQGEMDGDEISETDHLLPKEEIKAIYTVNVAQGGTNDTDVYGEQSQSSSDSDVGDVDRNKKEDSKSFGAVRLYGALGLCIGSVLCSILSEEYGNDFIIYFYDTQA